MQRRFALAQLARRREPALLLAGQTVSNFGDGVALVALTLLVLDTTHSASRLAWFAAARVTPLVVFVLVGDAIVDRFSRRLLLLISDVTRALLTAALAVLIATGVLKYVELLVFAVCFGTFDALFMPAMTALTPEIVPDDLLGAMNAVRPLSNNLVGNMLGPAVGGILATLSTTWAVGVDSATFVISATTLALMHPTPRPRRIADSTMLAEIRGDLRYVRTTTWLWTTLAGVAAINAFVFVPLSVLVPYFLRHSLHASAATVGYFFAASGLAGGLGALVASNLSTPRRRIRTMWGYWIAGTLSVTIVSVASHTWEIMIIPLIVSPTMILGNVIWESMMQREVPRELLGRASSVDWFISLGLAPVGLVVSGALATVVGVRTYLVALSLITVVPGLLIVSSRRANAIDVVAPTPEPDAA